MTKRHITGLLLLAGFAAAGSHAATITLVPSAGGVIQNDLFTVELKLDASDAPGTHPGLYLGEVIVDFNPAQLSYQGFVFTAPVQAASGPTTGSNGSQQTVTLGFRNATDLSTIGTFTFRAIGSPGTATIGVADADDFFGSFISKLPTDQPFYPQFTGTQVAISPIPLPATAWLLATGFALVGARARRARSPR